MSSWTHGYVADVEYTHGFYRELTPEILRFSALVNGNRVPPSGKPLTYCELGCGQGFTANLLAAANPHIKFYANDFNPTQVANARLLAEEGGLDNILFFDNSFEDFAEEPNLPKEFDIIVLHGIYSWISPETGSTSSISFAGN